MRNFIDRNQTTCFSGPSPERLPGHGNPSVLETQILIEALRKEIFAAISRGIGVFIHGCQAGFDILAAEQVLEIKNRRPQIQLVSVAPFAVHFFSADKCWTPHWENRTRKVLRHHDFGITLAEHYRQGIYDERNRVIMNHSCELICYYDGGKNGTAYTAAYAKANGKRVYNLYGKNLFIKI